MEESDARIVAIGTWLYAGTVPHEIRLVRWPVREGHELYPTPDGHAYVFGFTRGGMFATREEAFAWADRQPWGPVTWRDADEPATVMIVDDD